MKKWFIILLALVIGFLLIVVFWRIGTDISTTLTGTGTKDTFNVYFVNAAYLEAGASCGNVQPVVRPNITDIDLERRALLEVWKGPTRSEQEEGMVSALGENEYEFALFTIYPDKSAHIMLNKPIEGNPCQRVAATEQIRQTLLQFDTIDSVVITEHPPLPQ